MIVLPNPLYLGRGLTILPLQDGREGGLIPLKDLIKTILAPYDSSEGRIPGNGPALHEDRIHIRHIGRSA